MNISFILDESGSMYSGINDTIGGFNSYVAEIKGKPKFTLTKFGGKDGTVIPYKNVKLSKVKPLTKDTYVPYGNTPLLDAIGKTIASLKGKRKVLMVIQTDGEENASVEFTGEQIKEMIEKKQKIGWAFVFIGADIDAFSISRSFGISAGNVGSYGSQDPLAVSVMAAQTTRTYTASNGKQTTNLMEN